MSSAVQPTPENPLLIPSHPPAFPPSPPLSLEERAEYEHQIATLKRNLGEMVRFQNEWIQLAAHELRTPLTSLQLNLEVALRRSDASAAAPFLRHAREDSLRVIHLMEQLWKACEGKDPLALTSIEEADLRTVLQRALRQVQTRHGAAVFEVSLVDDGTGTDWSITTDPIRLEQVLINLAENSWKYGRGLPVHVKLAPLKAANDESTSSRGRQFRITFADQGEGLPEGKLEQLCRARERLPEHRSIEGTGWGLYVVRRIADALGATIQVRSQKEKGTCFEVQIPSSIICC